MVNQLLVSLINSILEEGVVTARGNYSYFCPKCKHYKRKLEINFDESSDYFQNFHCWNINCGLKGKKLINLFRYKSISDENLEKLKKLTKNNKNLFVQNYLKKEEKVILPKEFQSFKFSSDFVEKQALFYLKNRGISKKDIFTYNIGYCEEGSYKNKIIIPSYDKNGELNYFIGRSFDQSNYQKYKIPSISRNIIFFEFYINWKLPIILCEGVFDAMAIKRNSIPLLGGDIQPNLMKRLISSEVKEIYVVLDKDALSKAYLICENLIKENKIVYLVELSKKDPNEEGFLNMIELINNSLPLNYYDLLSKKITRI